MRALMWRRSATFLLLLACGPTVAVAQTGDGGDYTVPTGPVTIEMKNRGKDVLFFSGPDVVSRGERMTIVNRSNPRVVGRHTFSLVKRRVQPKTRRQRLRCDICPVIAKAHDFRPKRNRIAKPIVEVGRTGWDKSFGRIGDSWFVEKRNKRHTRVVSAEVGTRLSFFCGVHPSMKGSILVVD